MVAFLTDNKKNSRLFIFVLASLLWAMCALSLRAQNIYYSGLKNQDPISSFYIAGSMDNHTLIYVKDKKTNRHMIYHYDLKMNVDKKDDLSMIDPSNHVIGLFKLNEMEYMVFHVASDKKEGKKTCYYTRVHTRNIGASTPVALGSILSRDESNIYEMIQSPSGNYAVVYVIGKKDDKNAVLVTYCFTTSGNMTKSSVNVFPFQALLGEEFGETQINDKGDFLFYSLTKQRFQQIQNVKMYIQSTASKKLTMRYIDLNSDSFFTYQVKCFYHPQNNTWNLIYYYYAGSARFIDGMALKSWSNGENFELVSDNRNSFYDILLDVKKHLDPSTLEDINIDGNGISNKTFIALLKLKKEETDEEDNEEEASSSDSLIEEDEEASVDRLRHLMELFSLRDVNIIDAIPKDNGEFVLFLEDKENNRTSSSRSKAKNFFSSISPSLSVGFGTGIGLGGGGYGYDGYYGGYGGYPSSGIGTGIGVELPIYSNSNGEGGQPSIRQNLSNIIILDYKKDGSFQWGGSIQKNEGNGANENLAFCSIKSKDDIRLFYINQNTPSYMYSLSIKANGRVELSNSVKGVSAAYDIFPAMAKQTNQNSLIIPCMYKNELSFSRLIL